jgi:hypothetical protein
MTPGAPAALHYEPSTKIYRRPKPSLHVTIKKGPFSKEGPFSQQCVFCVLVKK